MKCFFLSTILLLSSILPARAELIGKHTFNSFIDTNYTFASVYMDGQQEKFSNDFDPHFPYSEFFRSNSSLTSQLTNGISQWVYFRVYDQIQYGIYEKDWSIIPNSSDFKGYYIEGFKFEVKPQDNGTVNYTYSVYGLVPEPNIFVLLAICSPILLLYRKR